MLSGEAQLPANQERDEMLLSYKMVAINFQNKDTPTVKTKAMDSAWYLKVDWAAPSSVST